MLSKEIADLMICIVSTYLEYEGSEDKGPLDCHLINFLTLNSLYQDKNITEFLFNIGDKFNDMLLEYFGDIKELPFDDD